ncbi:hypothetical protein VTO58DRAFT_107757 [Aureobasidium pullulans]
MTFELGFDPFNFAIAILALLTAAIEVLPLRLEKAYCHFLSQVLGFEQDGAESLCSYSTSEESDDAVRAGCYIDVNVATSKAHSRTQVCAENAKRIQTPAVTSAFVFSVFSERQSLSSLPISPYRQRKTSV